MCEIINPLTNFWAIGGAIEFTSHCVLSSSFTPSVSVTTGGTLVTKLVREEMMLLMMKQYRMTQRTLHTKRLRKKLLPSLSVLMAVKNLPKLVFQGYSV